MSSAASARSMFNSDLERTEAFAATERAHRFVVCSMLFAVVSMSCLSRIGYLSPPSGTGRQRDGS